MPDLLTDSTFTSPPDSKEQLAVLFCYAACPRLPPPTVAPATRSSSATPSHRELPFFDLDGNLADIFRSPKLTPQSSAPQPRLQLPLSPMWLFRRIERLWRLLHLCQIHIPIVDCTLLRFLLILPFPFLGSRNHSSNEPSLYWTLLSYRI